MYSWHVCVSFTSNSLICLMQNHVCNIWHLLLCCYVQGGNYPVAFQTWRQQRVSYLEASSSGLEFLSSKRLYLSEDWSHLRHIADINISLRSKHIQWVSVSCVTFAPLLFVSGRVGALTLTAATQQSVSNAERLSWGLGWWLGLTAGCTVANTHIWTLI